MAQSRSFERLGLSLTTSMATDVAAKLAVLMTTVIAARSLSPFLFGQYVGLTAAVLLSTSVFDLGLTTILTREVAAKRISIRAGLRQIAAHRLKLLPVWILVFGGSAYIVGGKGGLPALTILAFAWTSLVFSMNIALTAVVRAGMRFGYAGSAIAVGRWATAIVSGLAVVVNKGPAAITVLALALLMGELLCLALNASAVLKQLGSSDISTPATLTIRASLPFALNGILAIAYNRFDVVILTALTSTSQLTLYAPASRIQDAFYLIPSSFGLVALPLMAAARRHGGEREVRTLVRRLILLGVCIALPVAIVIFAFAGQLITLALGQSYVGAIQTTRILIWFLPFAVVQAPILAWLTAMGRGADTSKVFLLTFATAIGMHVCLDWRFGAIGGAVASLSRDPVAAAACLLLARNAGIIGRTYMREIGVGAVELTN